MCGNVPVGRRLCVLFLLLGELCVVLLGLLAAPTEMGEDGHDEELANGDEVWWWWWWWW